jgi:hypothetical protein
LMNVDELRIGGIARAAEVTWTATAEATMNAYRDVLGTAS